MHRSVPIIFVAVVLLVPAIASAQTRSRQDVPLHHFQLACNTCHAPQSTDNISDDTTIGKIEGDINKLCASSGCHDFEPSLNHPVGISPNGMVPEDMPLDSHSRITCLTCHDQPKSSDTSEYLDDSRERSLRLPQETQFCGSCHMETSGTLREQSHWQFSTRAHLGSINGRSSSIGSSTQNFGRIDIESRTCLSCHDDVVVTVPGDFETVRQRKSRWSKMADHPIGMSYDRAASQRPGHYRYPLFDEQIRLFDGKVGCGSCHNPYSQKENILSVSNERSTLCLSCHDK